MDSYTVDIIRKIADIQITALNKIKNNPITDTSTQVMFEVIGVTSKTINKYSNRYIQLYENIKLQPLCINLLNRYQLGLCIHILFHSEDLWLTENPIGVQGAWQLMFTAMKKFDKSKR